MEIPTDREINEVLDWCMDAEADGTHYHGMTYEQGVRAAIEWLRGEGEGDPR